MALGSTEPLAEMSTRNIPGGKGRPASKADDLTAICEPIVLKMWEPQHLTTLWVSTACYRDTFTPFTYYVLGRSWLIFQYRFCRNDNYIIYLDYIHRWQTQFHALIHESVILRRCENPKSRERLVAQWNISDPETGDG
jgi:hypothetical protein